MISMEITDVRVKTLDGSGKMRAVASITIDNVFVIHDIKIIHGEKGLFIAMPSKKSTDGQYRDVVHPIDTDTRSMSQDIVLTHYNKLVLI